MMRIIIFLFFWTFFSSIIFAQIAVTNTAPYNIAENIVDDLLLGDDLETSNWSWQNGSTNIGYFDGNTANIGFEEGVIMSTGGINFVTTGAGAGPGMSGDADLELALSAIGMTGFSVNNVTILEFDFVANSESMAFNYVFGSMEYTGYTCSNFNDIFGFFLSGPGIVGPYTNDGVNIALVPDPDNPGDYTDTPVAINTVNNGDPNEDWGGQCESLDSNWESYNIFWIDNDYSGAGWQGVNEPPEPEFTVSGLTGFTTPLVAEYNGLECGETYHIKLAIADCADGILNSAVFIEANSFVSPSVVVNPLPNIDGPDLFGDPLAIYEGCAAAQLEFEASGNRDYDIVLGISANGTCEYGVDYAISYEDGSPLEECVNNDGVLTPCITIPASQSSIYLNVQAFYDDLNENFEDLEFVIDAINGVCQQAELAVSEINFNVYDQLPIVVDVENPSIIECFGDEVNLAPTSISGGYLPDDTEYTYEWYDQNGTLVGTDMSLNVTTSADAQYQVIVTDICQNQFVAADFDVEVISYPSVMMEPLNYYVCDGDVITITPIISGGSEDYSYVWPDNPNPCDCQSFSFEFDLDNGVSQNVDFQIIDNCSDLTYDFQVPIEVSETDAPIVNILISGEQFCPGDELVLTADNQGESTYIYEWINLGSDEFYVNDMATVSPDEDSVYELLVIDECNDEESSFFIAITVPTYDPPTFNVSDVIGCVGQELELIIENIISEGVQTQDDFTFLWSLGGETTQNIQVIVADNPETYSVVVTDLCGNASILDIEAVVSASIPPAPEFYFEQSGSIVNGQDSIKFIQVGSEFFTNFEWDFGDGNFSDEYEPLHVYDAEGDYYVTLTGSDDFGCTNFYNALVNIYPSLYFYSPTVFSPNGDGFNDQFQVSILGQDDFELFVFDRWGKQIFTTTDPNEGWDGTYPNGKEAPQDVYMYKVFMSSIGVGEKIERGRVSIIK